jgi:Lrp/AsnC family transcriptional regulator for asnA, asnC and gidA
MSGRSDRKQSVVPPDVTSPHDDLNRSIIQMLRHDGRTPFAEMAVALGVSEGTVRNRVNGLKQSGILRIVALVDPSAVEYETEAMLGLKMASGHAPQEIAERLNGCPEVIFILWVSGRFDLLVEIVAQDRDHFLKFLDEQVYSQGDIASVEVMTGLRNFKNQFLLKRNWS